jgi:integrase
MADSKSIAVLKKPRKDFPLTPRGDGPWCKRVHSKLRYFTGTAQEALDEWNRVKDRWLAGREAPPRGGYLSLADLVNQFLHHCGSTVTSSRRSHAVNVVRMIFNYGLKSGLLTNATDFGVELDKPSAKTLRQARAAKGERLYEPGQIKKLLKKAEPHMAAMILLAINGGLGNNDLALLRPEAFDLNKAWLDYPRPKTGLPRRVLLWPETVAAVKLAIAKRRQPKDPVDSGLLFIGKLGSSYVSQSGGHRIAHEFSDLCNSAGVQGRVFTT